MRPKTTTIKPGNAPAELDVVREQHEELMLLADQLYAIVRAGKTNGAVSALLHQIEQKALAHFKFEEGVIERMGYAGLERHRTLHKWIATDIHDLWARSITNNVAIEAAEFLRRWLQKHMDDEDSAWMAQYLSR